MKMMKTIVARHRFPTTIPPLWKDLLSLIKPGITCSNLLATVAGFRLASDGWSQPELMLWTVAGTFFVVSGGCIWNNVQDRDMDQRMIRTRLRPLPAGRIPWRWAGWLGFLFSLLGLLLLGWFVNGLAALWGAIGLGWYGLVYTAWLKRKSVWNTIVGGVAGAVPPLIGWTAVTGTMEPGAWVLFFLLFFWQPPHFYALALLKQEEYRQAGIPMWPVIRGWQETWEQMVAFSGILLPVSALLPLMGIVSWAYLWVVIPLGLVFCGWSAVGRWVRNRDHWARQCFRLSLLYLVGWVGAVMVFVQ
jgi:protoheme IX farnesyltransferase